MRQVDKYSYLPIKRQLDKYISSKDVFAAPDPKFFEEQLENPSQMLKKKRKNRFKKFLWVILFFISFFIAFSIFCGSASG